MGKVSDFDSDFIQLIDLNIFEDNFGRDDLQRLFDFVLIRELACFGSNGLGSKL